MLTAGSHRCRVVACALACTVFAPGLARAQWVSPAGTTTVSLGYQYTKVFDHLFADDQRVYMGNIYGQTLLLGANYVVWRALSLSAGAAYVTSMYVGDFAEHPTVDDGQYHGDFQDLTLDLRYMVPWQGIAFTPFVGSTIPLGDYNTMGHTSVGMGLSALTTGIAIGRSLDPFLPSAFLGASYNYSFVENHREHTLDSRGLGFNAGYLVGSSATVGASLNYSEKVDGIDWASGSGSHSDHDFMLNHDAMAKVKSMMAGGYVSFGITHQMSLTVSYSGVLYGENTHNAHSVTITPSWRFQAPYFGSSHSSPW